MSDQTAPQNPLDPTIPVPPPPSAAMPPVNLPPATYAPPAAAHTTVPEAPHVGAVGRPMTPDQERQWAALSHVVAGGATLLSGGTLGFVGALVLYLMNKERGPFVAHHAKNALNVQIATGIGLIVSFVLMLILVGFITYPLIYVLSLVYHGIGALKAWNGEWWKAPGVPDFVK